MTERSEAMAVDLRRLADIIERNPILEPLMRDALQRLTVFPEHVSIDSSAVVDVLRGEWMDMDYDLSDPAFDIDTAAIGSVTVRVTTRRVPRRLAAINGVPA